MTSAGYGGKLFESNIPSTIYVLMGSEGEYSDRTEFQFGWRLSEFEAQEWVLHTKISASILSAICHERGLNAAAVAKCLHMPLCDEYWCVAVTRLQLLLPDTYERIAAAIGGLANQA